MTQMLVMEEVKKTTRERPTDTAGGLMQERFSDVVPAVQEAMVAVNARWTVPLISRCFY